MRKLTTSLPFLFQARLADVGDADQAGACIPDRTRARRTEAEMQEEVTPTARQLQEVARREGIIPEGNPLSEEEWAVVEQEVTRRLAGNVLKGDYREKEGVMIRKALADLSGRGRK